MRLYFQLSLNYKDDVIRIVQQKISIRFLYFIHIYLLYSTLLCDEYEYESMRVMSMRKSRTLVGRKTKNLHHL